MSDLCKAMEHCLSQQPQRSRRNRWHKAHREVSRESERRFFVVIPLRDRGMTFISIKTVQPLRNDNSARDN